MRQIKIRAELCGRDVCRTRCGRDVCKTSIADGMYAERDADGMYAERALRTGCMQNEMFIFELQHPRAFLNMCPAKIQISLCIYTS